MAPIAGKPERAKRKYSAPACYVDSPLARKLAMTSPLHRPACALLLACAVLPFSCRAALSDEIQVYADDINAVGEFGLEVHLNGTPKGRSIPDYPNEVVPNHGIRLTPEFSYGLSKSLEAGLYVPTSFESDGSGSVAGAKLRMKWLPMHPEEGGSGAFAGANGELSRLQQKYSESRDSFELRLMGGYRSPDWLLAVNPVFGWSLSPGYRGSPDLSLGVKVARTIAEKVAAGLEYYSELGTVAHVLPLAKQANTLYGAVDVEWKGWGLNFGVGRGLTGSADRWTVKAIFSVPI
jgi:hypothetical protein